MVTHARRPLQCGRALFFRPLPEHIHNVEGPVRGVPIWRGYGYDRSFLIGSAAKVVSQEDTGWTSHETRQEGDND